MIHARPLLIGMVALFLAGLLLAACQPAAACRDPLGCLIVPRGRPVVIGAALMLTGVDGRDGQEALNGLELALGARKALAGHTLEIEKVDASFSIATCQAAATALAQNEAVAAVLGPQCGAGAADAAWILSNAGLTAITPAQPAAHETGTPGMFTVAPSAADLAAWLAGHLAGAGIQALAIYPDPAGAAPNPFAEPLCAAFTSAGGACLWPKDRFGQPLAAEAVYIPAGVAFAPGGLAGLRADPDFAGLPAYTAAASLPAPGAAMGDLAGLRLVTAGGSTGSPALVAAYQAAYSANPATAYVAGGYRAAGLLLTAIEESAQPGPDGSLLLPRQALRDALGRLAGADPTAAEALCRADPLCSLPEIILYQDRDGRWVEFGD